MLGLCWFHITSIYLYIVHIYIYTSYHYITTSQVFLVQPPWNDQYRSTTMKRSVSSFFSGIIQHFSPSSHASCLVKARDVGEHLAGFAAHHGLHVIGVHFVQVFLDDGVQQILAGPLFGHLLVEWGEASTLNQWEEDIYGSENHKLW